jgi:XTP/dITP diphosphohydrolase
MSDVKAEDDNDPSVESPTTIIIATHNSHKVEEIARSLVPLVGFALDLQPTKGKAPKEDGATFAENALIKARAAFAQTGLPSLSDDSGICVDALDGAPGINSARYTQAGTDVANRKALLEAMKGHKNREARFVCAVAFVTADSERVEVGEWPGKIRMAEKGDNGFGYDPIFAPDHLTVTAAELSVNEKAVLSHRARALGQIAPAINRYIAESRT